MRIHLVSFINFENAIEAENLWFKCSPNISEYSLLVDGDPIFENRRNTRTIMEETEPNVSHIDLEGINFDFWI